MSVDVDYHKRLDWLAELMLLSPKKKVRDLQAEALKYYPLESTEAQRHWLSIETSFKAAGRATELAKEKKK